MGVSDLLKSFYSNVNVKYIKSKTLLFLIVDIYNIYYVIILTVEHLMY